jgi:hypothetical protein
MTIGQIILGSYAVVVLGLYGLVRGAAALAKRDLDAFLERVPHVKGDEKFGGWTEVGTDHD